MPTEKIPGHSFGADSSLEAKLEAGKGQLGLAASGATGDFLRHASGKSIDKRW